MFATTQTILPSSIIITTFIMFQVRCFVNFVAKVNCSHLRQNGESKWEGCRGEKEPSQSDRGRDQGSGVQLCIIILIVIFISVPIFVVQATPHPHLHQCPHNHHSPPFSNFLLIFIYKRKGKGKINCIGAQ